MNQLCDHRSPHKLIIVAALSALLVLGCAETSERNKGVRYGAAGGALVGLTMGALTGDGKYAAAGLAAGAVAGAAAGAYDDYRNDRQDYRAETIAGAIAQRDKGGDGEAPKGWDEIDAFIGKWNVSMWFINDKNERIDANAKAVSSLDSTKSITFKFSERQGIRNGQSGFHQCRRKPLCRPL